jgi:radial spoke head protein 4A
MRSLD